MADVSLAFAPIAAERSRALDDAGRRRRATTCSSPRTAPATSTFPARLERLVALLERLDGSVVFPLHPRTAKRLDEAGLRERAGGGRDRHRARSAISTSSQLARNARAVLTDSGGVQKEAYLLGTPCVTLRDTTEWVETVEAGWNVLVDLDADAALSALERPVPAGERPDLYGGGRAGERIRDVLDSYTAQP